MNNAMVIMYQTKHRPRVTIVTVCVTSYEFQLQLHVHRWRQNYNNLPRIGAINPPMLHVVSALVYLLTRIDIAGVFQVIVAEGARHASSPV